MEVFVSFERSGGSLTEVVGWGLEETNYGITQIPVGFTALILLDEFNDSRPVRFAGECGDEVGGQMVGKGRGTELCEFSEAIGSNLKISITVLAGGLEGAAVVAVEILLVDGGKEVID